MQCRSDIPNNCPPLTTGQIQDLKRVFTGSIFPMDIKNHERPDDPDESDDTEEGLLEPIETLELRSEQKIAMEALVDYDGSSDSVEDGEDEGAFDGDGQGGDQEEFREYAEGYVDEKSGKSWLQKAYQKIMLTNRPKAPRKTRN